MTELEKIILYLGQFLKPQPIFKPTIAYGPFSFPELFSRFFRIIEERYLPSPFWRIKFEMNQRLNDDSAGRN